MSQEKFNGLIILCTDKEIIEHPNVDTIISNYI
jgi:hypothetical protein